MRRYEVLEKADSPYVLLDKNKNIFLIQGKSFPENVTEFYEPIIQWFEEYFKNPNEKTIIEFKLDYINTATSKSLINLLLIFKRELEKGKDIQIKWYYQVDDEDIKDSGLEFSEIVKIPIEIIEINE
ncbi:MAG: DUF1987 domain-containing protein [Bacteroidales bacterium]|nr:DUF1987 domain-containing protein [Bacteroidales bacterium]